MSSVQSKKLSNSRVSAPPRGKPGKPVSCCGYLDRQPRSLVDRQPRSTSSALLAAILLLTGSVVDTPANMFAPDCSVFATAIFFLLLPLVRSARPSLRLSG
ncbi:uncharacterized protein V6R79_000586 [Siganus canaliculatus]